MCRASSRLSFANARLPAADGRASRADVRRKETRVPEIILHHYPMSPFSEKVRKVLAVKRIEWRAVEQPMWNPKPKLTPLTGGYRRIPVMQIGADVYCDTACILRALEARVPEPTLFPGDQQGAAEVIA